MIKFLSEEYTLQYNTTCDRKRVSSSDLVVKSQYLKFMQDNISCYRKKKKKATSNYCSNTNYCTSMY